MYIAVEPLDGVALLRVWRVSVSISHIECLSDQTRDDSRIIQPWKSVEIFLDRHRSRDGFRSVAHWPEKVFPKLSGRICETAIQLQMTG